MSGILKDFSRYFLVAIMQNRLSYVNLAANVSVQLFVTF